MTARASLRELARAAEFLEDAPGTESVHERLARLLASYREELLGHFERLCEELDGASEPRSIARLDELITYLRGRT